MVLSQSMEEPDPDPNLESAAERPRPQEGSDPEIGRSPTRGGKPPRTSEIFRSVVAHSGDAPLVTDSPALPGDPVEPAGEAIPDLGVLERRTDSTDELVAADRHLEGHIPWGQIVLLSYASILTLALMWLLWSGRVPRPAAPETPAPESAAAEKAAAEAPSRAAPSDAESPPPPLPAENVAALGKPIRLGDLQITPLSVEARTVELVRTIDSRARRRENECLVLQLGFLNLSKNQTFSPLDRLLVRDRELRSFDPYIATSEGPNIRLFPLALDSEWSILGQSFPVLAPGQSARTFIAAEPGSAGQPSDEMTWRLPLRIGVYRSDMLGVRFTKAEVRRIRPSPFRRPAPSGFEVKKEPIR
jgi:hypothetical protein